MTTTVRVVINVPGYNAYRKNDSVTALLESLGNDIGDRFQASVTAYSNAHNLPTDDRPDVVVRTAKNASRTQVYVSANSFRARLAEAKERLLLAALGGAP